MNPLNVAVLYSSQRTARQGIRAARFVERSLRKRGHDVTLVDSLKADLPMLDRMFKEFGTDEAPPAMQRVADTLAAADGFVVVSAEYNHSIPAALKNLLDHFQTEYHHKPSGIVTYSAGPFGGVRGLANLRTILAELGTPAIPTTLPVSAVQRAFDEDGNAVDSAYEKRFDRFAAELEWYATALRSARANTGNTDGTG